MVEKVVSTAWSGMVRYPRAVESYCYCLSGVALLV